MLIAGVVLSQLMLKKIANGINEIILMHSTELISRMDILLVLFKELEKLLLSVSVSKPLPGRVTSEHGHSWAAVDWESILIVGAMS